MIQTLLDACQFVLEDPGEAQSSDWLASIMMEMKLMKRPMPRTPEGWLLEIRLAIKDTRETEPFSTLTGRRITEASLFHLAPLVCQVPGQEAGGQGGGSGHSNGSGELCPELRPR